MHLLHCFLLCVYDSVLSRLEQEYCIFLPLVTFQMTEFTNWIETAAVEDTAVGTVDVFDRYEQTVDRSGLLGSNSEQRSMDAMPSDRAEIPRALIP
ncbi:unnamed protein product [Cuscuta campestris]|uniref:Uncharacterized protein n=1 Tax=Cuscuta campestris TaxID=132261 RepID=A0A484KEG7_9ASTE|nr:unnamed protein product [Cuscuta campestris]